MAALLKDAMKPNLVQTLEGTPALIHGGPFANIAHGTNSVIATRLALSLADYVVTESGFASDLGAEKFFDIVVRTGHIPPPAACVLVATLRALKFHGGVKLTDLAAENIGALEKGFDNLRKHMENIRLFGVPFVVALNQFPDDSELEIRRFFDLCQADGARAALSDVYGQGGAGGVELARAVMRVDRERAAPFSVPLPAGYAARREDRDHRDEDLRRGRHRHGGQRRGASSSSWRPTGSADCPSASPRRSTRCPTTPRRSAGPPGSR